MTLQSASSRWLAGAAAFVAGVIVLSLIVALVSGSDADLLPEDTPEGSVQRYLQAVEDGDLQRAYDYLSPALKEDCSYSNFRNSTRWFEQGDRRITLEATEPFDGRVEVRVQVTQFSVDPPFGSRESSFTQRYVMEELDEGWRFAEPPWPLGFCPPPTVEQPKEPPATEQPKE